MWLCKVESVKKHHAHHSASKQSHHHPNKRVDSMISQTLMCHFDNETLRL
jgi:hypothetical protein